MNQKIIVLRGISGSGKTTFCTKFLKDNPDYVRVNRDEFRHMIACTGNNLLPRELENLITNMQHSCILESLNLGKNVIIDNTNLKKEYLEDILLKYNHLADIEIKEFDDSFYPETCKIRVRLRDNITDVSYIDKQITGYSRMKGEDLIYHKVQPLVLDNTLGPNNTLEECIICDLDGTLALYKDKDPYNRDFENDNCSYPVERIINTLQLANYQPSIFFLSGRSDKYRDQTMQFLNKNKLDTEIYHLIMRKEGDNRRDSIVKREMFMNNIYGKYDPLFVIDDRLQVIEECWNRLGVFVINVNQGNKRF